MKLVVATNNQGKIRELRRLLEGFEIDVEGLDVFDGLVEPEETGETFAENAALKATSYALQTKRWTISDDSGLEVDALGGAPGVLSARYAGENASDAERVGKLLGELTGVDAGSRTARFICAIAVADEEGEVRFATEGVCEGRIGNEPRGGNGFGYDPIFVPTGFSKTFGELSIEAKEEFSHRAKAIAQIIRYLQDFRVHQLDQ